MLAPLDMNGNSIINCPNLQTHDLAGTPVTVGTGPGTVAAGNDPRISGAAQKSANLSDLSSPQAARTSLGLGDASTRNVGIDFGNVVAVGPDGKVPSSVLPTNAGSAGLLASVNNLADVASISTARTNLGLKTAALVDMGLTSGKIPVLGSNNKFPTSVIDYSPVASSGGGGGGSVGVLVSNYYGGTNPSETISGGPHAGQADYLGAYNRAVATGAKLIRFDAGTYYVSGTLVQATDGVIIRGAGRQNTVIWCTDNTKPVIKKNLALTGCEVSDLWVRHDTGTQNSNGTPTAGPTGMTSAAHGIDYGNTGSTCQITNVKATWNFDNFNMGGTDFSRITDCEASLAVQDNYHFTPNGAEGTLIYVNTSCQWNPQRCNSTFSGRHSYHWESLAKWQGNTYNGVCNSGTMENCDDFAAGQCAVKVTGTPTCPFVALRMHGGFFGQNFSGNLIVIDSYAGDHFLHFDYIELSVGCGVELTQNNGDVSIGPGFVNGHALDGIYTRAANLYLNGPKINTCGQSNTSGRQNAVFVSPRSDAIVPSVTGTFHTDLNLSSLQKYGFYSPNVDNHLLTGCNLRNNFTGASLLPVGFGNTMITGCLPFSANVNFHTTGASAFAGDVNVVNSPAGLTSTVYVNSGGVVAKNIGANTSLTSNGTLNVATQATFAADVQAVTLHVSGQSAFSSPANFTGSGTQIFVNSGGISAANLGATNSIVSNNILQAAGLTYLNGGAVVASGTGIYWSNATAGQIANTINTAANPYVNGTVYAPSSGGVGNFTSLNVSGNVSVGGDVTTGTLHVTTLSVSGQSYLQGAQFQGTIYCTGGGQAIVTQSGGTLTLSGDLNSTQYIYARGYQSGSPSGVGLSTGIFSAQNGFYHNGSYVG